MEKKKIGISKKKRRRKEKKEGNQRCPINS